MANLSRFKGWQNDPDNSRLNALYNGTAFLRATASALTLPLATTISGAVSAASSILSSSATGGIGYSTGAGGTVTQETNKSTGVTLSKVTGAITMNNAELTAGAEVTFTVTNTAVAATDAVLVHHASGGTAGAYMAQCTEVGAGSFKITVSNLSAGNLSEAIVLRFVVIKAVSA